VTSGNAQPSLGIGALSVFGTRIGGLLLAAASTFVLARLLGPNDLGAYYLLILLPVTALALLSLGLPSALTYMAGRGENFNQVRTVAILLALLITVPIVVAGVFLAAPLSGIFPTAPRGLIPLALLATPGTFLISFSGALALGRQRIGIYNALVLGQGVLLIVLQVVVVGLLRAGLDGALAVYVGVAIGWGSVAAAVAIRIEPFSVDLDPRTTRTIVSYGLRLVPASLAGFFSYRADVFLIAAILRDPGAVGAYGLAVNVAELGFYVPDAVSTVLFPRVAASDERGARELVPVVTRTTLLLTSVVVAGLAVAAAMVLPLILPAFTGSVIPAIVLLPGIVGLSASKVLSGYLSGTGRPRSVSIVASVALGINLVANLVLIPVLGIAGAAAASLISYSTNGALMVRESARLGRIPIPDMVIPRASDLALVRTRVSARLRSRTAA
jgi:O-antigen/teichoic acid export membrane protein